MSYVAPFHAHTAQHENILAFVEDEQRERGYEAEGGDEDDEREDKVDAEPLGAVNLKVEGLLVVAVLDDE